MTQDEKWMMKYQKVMESIKAHHHNPSRHRIEEHDMLNRVKANRKLLNVGIMELERVKLFEKLQELSEKYKYKNQYE